MQVSRKYQVAADIALLAVTFIWGITFVVVKEALEAIGPYWFLAIRFLIAGSFLALLRYRALRGIKTDTLKAGVIVGLALFGGYAFQTVGLQYTTASNAGFITGLSVVLVPLIAGIMSRRLPHWAAMLGVGSATCGLALLSIQDNLRISYGDVLIFFCALCFAAHIILVGKYAPRVSTYHLAVLQIFTVGFISLAVAPVLETFPERLAPAVQIALVATAIPATALAFLIQSAAQKFTSPTHTAVIFTMEPVFAGLGAWLLAGETLSLRQWVGGAAILFGMLITVLKMPAEEQESQHPGSQAAQTQTGA
ncbi:DMT family transporter [Desulforudis sp. 1088]|uniref:DMT family transporter n=1 Tax=unclassified Candidatus Desulforudis TaxID=2635950 RepID=UPI0034782FB6